MTDLGDLPLHLPKHVAIIMDGNGRWAKKRYLPREAGHYQGMSAVRETVRAACDMGLENLTLFAFSSENWKRPKTEVGALMGLFRAYFRSDMDELVERNVRMRIIGHRGRVASDIQQMIEESEKRTLANTGMNLTFAFDYGGQEEIVAAARELARAAADGRLDPETITPELFAARLFTSALPAPDLVIRTSGEHRLSNFLLWQSAYAELLFVDTLWPDFDRAVLIAALNQFAARERRFGALDFGSRGVTMSQQHPGQAMRTASEGVLRVLFGVVLAVIAVSLLLWPHWFAGITVLMTAFGAREWHRMVRSPAQREIADQQPIHVQIVITVAAIACAVMALVLRIVPLAFASLAAGAIASFVWARRRDDNPVWHAGGVLYLGLPSLALVGLLIFAAQGLKVLLGLFLIVWATDTGALVFGKLIGGPKIAPRISPGKTWAGTLGGSITAAMVFGLYIALFSFNVPLAMLFAFGFSFVAHGGDLFESLVKRRFGTKDSGGLIPGHGGVLDRMDSLFAASVAMALLVFVLHFNPLFGGRV